MTLDWQSAAEHLHAELKRFFDFQFGIWSSGFGIAPAVACSGGADSLAALLLTWAKFPEARQKLCVLHYDHAVRENSAEDAAFVRGVCSSLGVEFVFERRVPATGKKYSEAELRAARLDFFKREMSVRGIKILVQGHQRDDVAENLLMRLTRGSGTEGLAAPRAVSRQADGRIFVRPLLETPKAKILAALTACGIPWREDSTNAGTDYFRNRIRNCVLPELRNAAPFENIARSRKLLEEDVEALDFFANSFLEKSRENLSFENQPKAIIRRVIQKIFSREKIKTDGATLIDAFVESVTTGTPLKRQIGEKQISWTGKQLEISPTNQDRNSESEIRNFSSDTSPPHPLWKIEKVKITDTLFEQICSGTFSPNETVFLAGTPEISVRPLLPGEKFRPLGAPGEKLVRRIFIDKKIPKLQRNRLPVFADGTGIAWIPGLPPAERFRIHCAGTTALRLTYRSASLV